MREVPNPMVRPVHLARMRSLPKAARRQIVSTDLRLSLGKVRRRLRLGTMKGRDVEVPLTGGSVFLDGKTMEIDYLTILSIFYVEIFDVGCQDRVVIDLGGHKGYFGAYALEHGAHAVYSFEPQSDNYAALQRAADTFNARGSRWKIERSAIGSTAGMVDLHVSSASWSHSIYAPNMGKQVSVEKVELRPFADVIAKVRSEHPEREIAVKINIEGAAGDVILGTSPELWGEISEVHLEWEPTTKDPVDGLLAHLESAGLKLTRRRGHLYRLERTAS